MKENVLILKVSKKRRADERKRNLQIKKGTNAQIMKERGKPGSEKGQQISHRCKITKRVIECVDCAYN